jgi:hypothetical protein
MKLSVSLVIVLSIVSMLESASAATVGQIDTFQDGTTDNWFAGGLGMGQVPPIPPTVITNGGPQGAGDRYLQITGLGGPPAAGSRIAAINLAQWAGDYLHSGISAISMDLKNFGSTDLTVRLLFEDPMMAPPADQAVTTFGQFLPVGGGWTHTTFAISPAAMTLLFGNINTLLANTTLVRIIDSPTPTDAVSIAGVLGVDNIAAVPEPATLLPALSALAWLIVRRVRNRV